MAGILNNKERMIDFIMTKQGRRQMADGRMRIEFATVTDAQTFYQGSGSFGVAEPAGSRLFFEASERPQDMIVPELQAGSSMQPFRAGDFMITGKTIASGTFMKGATQQTTELTGTDIINKSEALLSSLTKNFQDLRITSTDDIFSDTSNFSLANNTASFVLTDATFGDYTNNDPNPLDASIDLSSAPSIFADKRFANLPNFRYLPPVNLPLPGEEPVKLSEQYPKLSSGDEFSLEELHQILSVKQSVVIKYSDTSRDNNLIGQLFEMSADGVEKLSVLDYGSYTMPSAPLSEDEFGETPSTVEQYYFVGKMQKDKDGVDTFLNLFTVVFSQ